MKFRCRYLLSPSNMPITRLIKLVSDLTMADGILLRQIGFEGFVRLVKICTSKKMAQLVHPESIP